MKVLINLTCFMNDEIYNQHWFYKDYLINTLMFQLCEKLKYQILRAIIGLHEDSQRPHYHLFILAELTEDAKKYKTLNEKIQRELRMLEYPSINYSNQEIKVSYLYEGETRKRQKATIVYDETAMRYPLKEGNDHYSSYNIPNDELQILRNEAIKQYNIYKQKQLTEEIKDKLKEDNKIKLEEFILEKIKTKDADSKTMIRIAAGYIIEYCLQNDMSFNINQLKNKAINILRKHDFITTEEILDLLYL